MLSLQIIPKTFGLRAYFLTFTLLFLTTACSVFAGNELWGVAVHKSPNDQREYQYIELPNQLRVLLISDPEADKAAASMDVGVGSYDDPQQRQGLAHFLEHMLFLGTEKYPTAGEYQAFISSKGGSHNAYTSGEHTNYFFDVESAYLEESLDRFAQFFIAPLFTPEYVDRERHAVHSEFRAKFKNSYRRQLDVIRQLVRPEHPMSKFSVGSLETLADTESGSVVDDLHTFYQDFYSSSNMTLVVLGRESLDELKEMVVPRFKQIPLRKVKESVSGESLYDPQTLPQRVAIKSLKNERRMTLSFAVPSTVGLYQEKPLQYIGHLLGHEGRGSLFSVLKEMGLAEGLSAGGRANGRNQGTFEISILLTEEGYKNYQKVACIAFKMIDKVVADGVDRWRFKEQKQLSEMAFRFSEKTEAIHAVSQWSNQMHFYPAEDIIRGAYAFDVFDGDLIKEFLSYLTPENLTLVVSSPDIEGDQITPRYDVPFSREKISADSVTQAKGELKQLQLPAKNPFIPGRLEIKESNTDDQAVPELIKNSKHFQLWFKQDDSFRVPRAEIRIRVYSPAVGQQKQNAALGQLYAALVNDALNEYTYSAYLAGLSFSMQANSRGFDLVLSGYSDRQGLLLTRILEVIDHNRFSAERFQNLQSELVRKWRNQTRLTPYEQLLSKLPVLLYSPLWDQQDLADTLEASSFDDFKAFSSRLWQGSRVQMMVYGNVFRQDAIKFGSLAEKHLYSQPDELTAPLAAAKVVDLSKGVQQYYLEVDHQDVAAVFYLQALSDSSQDRALVLMTEQMLRSSFFHQLRTERQLGYIVFASSMALKDVSGNIFVVQSPSASLSEVVNEISAFLQRTAGSVDDFETNRRAVLTRLTQSPKNLGEQADRFWSEIVSGAAGFDRRSNLIDSVKSLSQQDFLNYSQSLSGNPQALMLLAGSAEHLKGQLTPELDLGGRLIDAEQLKARLPAFTYP